MYIVITGGRDYKNQQQFNDILDLVRPDFIAVGDCPTGADAFARDWIKENLFAGVRLYVADWNKFGRAAGPIRNREMLECSKDFDFVLAFPGGKGTNDCVRQARQVGLTVLRIEE